MVQEPAPLSFEAARRTYNRIGRFQDWQRYEHAALAELIAHADFGSASSIFEFGCGTGALAARLLRDQLPSDATYRGVDISDTMVRLTERRLSPWRDRSSVERIDGTTPLPGPDGKHDRFVATYVFDLLTEEHARAVLREAERLLRPAGLLCLAGLTEGSTGPQRLVTGAWGRLWRLRPSLMGGCRPIRIAPMLTESWEVIHCRVVSSWAVPTEVVVAERVD